MPHSNQRIVSALAKRAAFSVSGALAPFRPPMLANPLLSKSERSDPNALDPTLVTPDQFAALPTRVLPITRETRTVNAIGYQRGDIHGMPEYCVTVGMKQILAARRVYIALNREWQHGVARRALFGPQDAHVPASLLQRHGSVDFVATDSIARGL